MNAIRSRGSGGVGRRDDIEDGGIFLGVGVSQSNTPDFANRKLEGFRPRQQTRRWCHEAREPSVSMFQTVHVVSMNDVTMRLGAFSFQEKLVSGAPEDWF